MASATKAKAETTAARRVVITTEFRGVFFGTLTEYDRDRREATLADARNCVYWPQQNKGFLGLAVDGPLSGARVGKAVPSLTLTHVTSIVDCTPEAVKLWEAGPWS